jgi:hypothetical protein
MHEEKRTHYSKLCHYRLCDGLSSSLAYVEVPACVHSHPDHLVIFIVIIIGAASMLINDLSKM